MEIELISECLLLKLGLSAVQVGLISIILQPSLHVLLGCLERLMSSSSLEGIIFLLIRAKRSSMQQLASAVASCGLWFLSTR